MKEYEVTITETLQKIVAVEASSREEAQALVEEMWKKGDVVLDADSFVDADFACGNGHETKAQETIDVLLVEPGQYPRMAAIGTSLPEEFRKKYADKFRSPETFLKMGRGIMAVSMEPKPPASREEKKSPGMEL